MCSTVCSSVCLSSHSRDWSYSNWQVIKRHGGETQLTNVLTFTGWDAPSDQWVSLSDSEYRAGLVLVCHDLSDVTPYLLVESWHVGIQSPLACFHLWHTSAKWWAEQTLSFFFSFAFIFHRLTITIRGIIIRRSVMQGSYSGTRSTNLLFQFSSFQRKSQFSCICPPFFIVTYFHAVRLVECGVCAVSIPCSCACGYPVLILIDEPSPTVLDSDADRVSRPGCLLISRGVQWLLETTWLLILSVWLCWIAYKEINHCSFMIIYKWMFPSISDAKFIDHVS